MSYDLLKMRRELGRAKRSLQDVDRQLAAAERAHAAAERQGDSRGVRHQAENLRLLERRAGELANEISTLEADIRRYS